MLAVLPAGASSEAGCLARVWNPIFVEVPGYRFAREAAVPLPGGDLCAGRREDFLDERCEVLRACVGVQDAGAQRLVAAEDGAGDEGAASRLDRLRQCAVELVQPGGRAAGG